MAAIVEVEMSFAKGQTVWLTKWATTIGIVVTQIEDAHLCDPRPGITPQVGVLALPGLPKHDDLTHGLPWVNGQRIHYFFKPDWHTDREEAILRVKKVISDKRAALKRTIAALDKAERHLLNNATDPSLDIRI